ncbi:AraC family transcriptional regulator [Pelagicoccus sp. SDUM812005]|uniref:AraC family transcriptional regulator n=1 Tax=Pelagicoccus sp. SDUM812005 TaxID=3041257 RepID=UPI00280D998C|nr:AraC family transcriptional regulator [Pelagicoccus sp. SDUM812005]MDQ8181399.1 AraC family transcriptional regulator [Pelagicoccus sp. SDUM812005]
MLEVKSWFSNIDPTVSLNQLFEHLPGVMYFVKDRESRILMGNREFAQRCGLASAEDLRGQSDVDIFPAYMARKFRADDLEVLRSGKPLLNLVELFPSRERLPEWFITQKFPMRDLSGKTVGVCGIVQSYERMLDHSNDVIFTLVEYIRSHYSEPISIPALAKRIGLSQRQLERRFQETFRTTPRQYIVRLRVLIASDRLLNSDTPITDIAIDSGFYDHSSFIRHFRSIFETTPLAYRKRRHLSKK